MRDLAWDDVRDKFDPLANGTLPDVRIEGTNLDDWQAVIDLPRVKGWRHEYEENGTAMPLPARAVDIIGRAAESFPEVRIWPDPEFLIIFRPYTEVRIEFDLNLREVQGQAGIDKLCTLLRTFGRLLGKPVLMFPEDGTDAADIGYIPDADRVVNLVPPERRHPPAATAVTVTPRFDQAMRLMRRRDPQAQEDGFHQLRPHAAEHLKELMQAFETEADHGLRCWLLELVGEARSSESLPFLVAQLTSADPDFRSWAKRGLQLLGTREARRALHETKQQSDGL